MDHVKSLAGIVKRCMVFLIVVVSVTAVSGISHGLMVRMSLDDLAGTAEVGIVGMVQQVESRYTKDGDSIYTAASVSVEKSLKGSPGQFVTVEYEGGEVGDTGLKVSDAPDLEKGEKVVLFLKSKGIEDSAAFMVVGNAQGKYSIKDGIASRSGFETVGGLSAGDDALPLTDLVSRVKKGE